MSDVNIFLETDVVLDCLKRREPNYESSRLLLIAGAAGRVRLWITALQAVGLVCLLSNGGEERLLPAARDRVRGLLSFAEVHPLSECTIDRFLRSNWSDCEDYLICEAAMNEGADYIVTSGKGKLLDTCIEHGSCEELFDWLRKEKGISL